MRHAWLIICLLFASGCSTAARTYAPELPHTDRPSLRFLHVMNTGQALRVEGCLDEARDFGTWTFQMFLDTDQNPRTGSNGSEYVVRGVEPLDDGALVVRAMRYREGIAEQVGTALFIAQGERFAFELPLRVIEDDGMLRWQLAIQDGATGFGYVGTCERYLAFR